MASTYSDLKIELIGTGEQTGTWGTTTNNNFSVAVGEAITGSADVAFSSSDVTLTLTDTNAAQTARNLRLNLTGTSGGARNLILGSGCQIEKLYLINNGLADAVTVKNTSGTGIVVPAGKSMFVYNNGTNVVDAITYLSAIGTGVFDAGTVSAPSITFTGDTNTGIYSPAADTIGFTEGGVEAMRINSSGVVNIGIGAFGTTPATTGVIRIPNASPIYARNADNTADRHVIAFNSSGQVAIAGDGNDTIIGTTSGNVGIGTATPSSFNAAADNLVVGTTSGNNGITIVGGTTGVSSIYMADGTTGNAAYRGYIEYRHADDAMVFGTSASERMRIDSSGNVGIGTSSPAKRLDVIGTGDSQFRVGSAAATSYDIGRVNANGLLQFYGNQSGANGFIFTGADGERMRIDSSGNVGIGITNPSQKLIVIGNIANTGRLIPNTSSTGTVNLLEFSQGGARGAGNNWGMFWSDNTGETNAALWASYTGGNNAAALVFGTNAGVGGSSGIASTTERMRISSGGNVGIGTSNPAGKLQIDLGNLSTVGNLSNSGLNITGNSGATGNIYQIGFGYATGATNAPAAIYALTTSNAGFNSNAICFATRDVTTDTAPTERMRIASDGRLLIGKTAAGMSNNGVEYEGSNGGFLIARGGNPVLFVNRNTDDGTLVEFRQADATEGTISVSGSTVSYNGGHLSRWSQWQNQTGKPDVYRGSVLESTNDMCEWNQDNEQATKTIVSTTAKSKTVAGVFDMYDTDDKNNPYDFYVAQSGDFVIRIAQGVVVENGDLLESAGDGTATPQADDICRSSTIAKVTSNYVSTTYADGSYCVPCILMIG